MQSLNPPPQKTGYSLSPPVLLAAATGQGGKTWHEEMKSGERHHIDSQFSQISIELARETQTGGHPTHGGRDQVVEVTVCGRGQLQCAEADVIQRFVINAVSLIRVLDQLVNGEGGIVWLHHCV